MQKLFGLAGDPVEQWKPHFRDVAAKTQRDPSPRVNQKSLLRPVCAACPRLPATGTLVLTAVSVADGLLQGALSAFLAWSVSRDLLF